MASSEYDGLDASSAETCIRWLAIRLAINVWVSSI